MKEQFKIKLQFYLFLVITISLFACEQETTISKSQLKDKIKGGWAGQVIGCTYGGPTEFKFNGKMIPGDHNIPWNNERCLWYYQNEPGLYDDIYMDLTFVDVFEKEGLDAPATAHALAFANADYPLWHANQAARYNILNGIMPPQSGHWLYNPHSEDIDFQIEADFAGLMSPGLVNTASEICDKVGHIMNYGDGWYGGVYVAAMYSLAFVSDDIDFVVNEGLKAIPEESTFYQCMADVIQWHQQYPDDWTKTWDACHEKWSNDVGCSDGVFADFDIDAKINAAYILVGLLYGEGDFGKTIDISTRCGHDSDCNPASAAGILGTMIGYENIPDEWQSPIHQVEDMDFKYTTMSLNDVYEIGYKHATEVLKQNGAKFNGEMIEMPNQPVQPVQLEVGFEGHYPKERIHIGKFLNTETPEIVIDFEGNGFVLGSWIWEVEPDYIFNLEMEIDGQLIESYTMPTSFITRRHDVAWKFQLEEGKHQVKVRVLNPREGYKIDVNDLITYTSDENKNGYLNH
ncbi:ADP-ribosylglycohydrolase family protein [Sunxiuqinia sp. A32]|uniref:ADP-ribosylglycohydrolase family protein n=1 Tax=Sunxiuqinia sp. A32 TaxID=3461496 RepID=UPI00404543BF